MSDFYAEAERYNIQCPGNEDLNLIFRTFSPYLYPFIIEFCILIVGIFYMVWSNISHCPKKLSASGHSHEEHHEEMENGKLKNAHHNLTGSSASSDHCKNLTEHEDQYRSSSFVYADCHASNRGLFAGLLLMILTIVFIILFFVAVNEEWVWFTVPSESNRTLSLFNHNILQFHISCIFQERCLFLKIIFIAHIYCSKNIIIGLKNFWVLSKIYLKYLNFIRKMIVWCLIISTEIFMWYLLYVMKLQGFCIFSRTQMFLRQTKKFFWSLLFTFEI